MRSVRWIFYVGLGVVAGLLWSGNPFMLRDALHAQEPVQTVPSAMPDVIEARAFVLRDSEGKIRAELSLDDDESPRISMRDRFGRTLMEFGLAMPGGHNPYLIFLDNKGRERVLMTVHEDQDPDIFFFDEEGNLAWGAP